MIDLSKVKLYSLANAFKNTGVYSTSVTLSGAIGPGVEVQFTSTITLPQNQIFAFAIAQYTEASKGGAAAWQKIPTFDAAFTSTPTGNLKAYVLSQINGNVLTFIAGAQNPYAGTETITNLTIPIVYVTYTLAN